VEEKIQKNKPFVEIIKNRMQDELNSHPRIKNQYDNSWPEKIDVDKKKIYLERPLLMLSALPK